MNRGYSYIHQKDRRASGMKKNFTPFVIVAMFLLLFVVSVRAFRSDESSLPEMTVAEQDLARSKLPGFTEETISKDGPVFGKAILTDPRGGDLKGEAVRDRQDGRFHIVARAFLPMIDEAHVYEGWLVRTFPFDFFSVGALVQNTDGEFVVEWFGESGKEYGDYDQAVITLESLGGSADPEEHVLEGKFGSW